MVTVAMNHGSYDSNTFWQSNSPGFTCCNYQFNDDQAYDPSSTTYSMITGSKRPNTRFNGRGGVTWRFAEQQKDCIGVGNTHVSNAYSGWIDLFGWGTSGHPHGANSFQPLSTSTSNGNYYAYGDESYSLFDQTGEADWGCNPISNGGDKPNQWRTLTKAEWAYVFNTRSTSSGKRYAKAQVDGVNGIILLPDGWNTSYYSLNSTNSGSATYTSNTITAAQWLTLEEHGAVFLPAAGYRYGTALSSVNGGGFYWSSSWCDGSSVSRIVFQNSTINTNGWAPPYCGCAVRLVCQSNPRVRTLGVTNITGYSVTVTGEVSSTGNNTVNTHGFHFKIGNSSYLWPCGSGAGGFTCTINRMFSPGTTYRIRAYAEIDGVKRYGNYITFTTAPQAEGTTDYPAYFSVSATKMVEFSKGNLQYQASTDTWRFATSQYSYIGANNSNISETYDGWIDLFAWGTSGHSHGAVEYQPWATDMEPDYYAYGNYSYNLDDVTGEADWGCNPISNGGNQPNQWRTLTHDEWVYLLETRSTSNGIRYAKVKVCGENGVILLPDMWQSSYYTLNNTNTADANYTSNVLNYSAWNTLEQHGAIFLPAAGYRDVTIMKGVGSSGYYWSASHSSSSNASAVSVTNTTLNSSFSRIRGYGCSVRLVRDAQ